MDEPWLNSRSCQVTSVRHHSANTLALASATTIVSVSASKNTAPMYSSSSVSVSKDFAIEREKDKA